MSLTLITNPVIGSNEIFAGFEPVEFVFKREDLAITSVTSGVSSKAKITVGTDLTTLLDPGDTIYVYSEGTNFIYDISAEIITITSTEITIDTPFIETGTGGYINYLKNYHVELQCVDKTNPDVNVLPFSLEADGDAAGNIAIDVSITNDLNRQRGAITKQFLDNSSIEFEVQYREVYLNSSNSFTLIDLKLLILVYATQQPEKEVILNQFDLPKIYLGYPAALAVAHSGGASGQTIEITYNEQDNNFLNIDSGTLGTLDADNNGFLLWEWNKDTSVLEATKYIDFEFEFEAISDFAVPDFASPDFVTT